jgi:hypothetical protein
MSRELRSFLRARTRQRVKHPTEDRMVRVEQVTRVGWDCLDGGKRITLNYEDMTPEQKDRVLSTKQ